MRTHGGKGSKQRPTDSKKFENNFDNIFRKTNENKAELLEEQVLDMSADLLESAKKLIDEVLEDVQEVEETPPLGLHAYNSLHRTRKVTMA